MLIQIDRAVSAAAPPTERRHAHVFETAHGFHVLVVDGSRVYSVDAATAERLRSQTGGDPAELERLGLLQPELPYVTDVAPRNMAVRSLSLAVAQKCNLACTYCYAQEGSFGAEPKDMDREAAHRAVRLLFEGARPGDTVNLAFLGGEPLVNRALIRECTLLAADRGSRNGVRTNFSITTNGTLVSPEDGEFFEDHGFAVTISLDGIGEDHDRQRPFRGGQASYARILDRVRPLLAVQRRMQVSARVTVTPGNLRLRVTLDGLFGAPVFRPCCTRLQVMARWTRARFRKCWHR